MGDRYFLEVDCPGCSYHDSDVYYAPTCGFTEWACPKCRELVDLEELTGISYADASNRTQIQEIVTRIGGVK